MPRKLSRPQEVDNEKTRGYDRTRNWCIILYPDSAPNNWREIIDETNIEWVESPLHDKDMISDETEDELKKPHWHVVLLYPSVQSYEQVKELTDSLNGPIPKKCKSVKGSIRYMVHKDNPEKFQYNWADIVCHGGADLQSLCAATATERLQIQKDIFNFIRDNGITEYGYLLDCIEKMGNDDWFNVAVNFSTMSLNAFLRSRRYMKEQGMLNQDSTKKGQENAKND